MIKNNNQETPLFELFMQDATDGVFAWSIVDHPANEAPAYLFSKEGQFMFSTDEKGIMQGVLLVPGKQIPRRTKEGGVKFVMFTKDEIEAIWKDNLAKGNQNNITIDHNGKRVTGIHTYEFRLTQENDAFHAKYSKEDLPAGSLVVSSFISDEALRGALKQKGSFGLSIEGNFKEKPAEVVMQSDIDEHDARAVVIDSILKSDKTDDEKLAAIEQLLK